MQQQNEEITVRVRQAEQTAREAQERVRMTVQKAHILEVRDHYQFWIVNREESSSLTRRWGRGGKAVDRVTKFRGLQVAARFLHTLTPQPTTVHVGDEYLCHSVPPQPGAIHWCHMMEGQPVILTELTSTSLRAILE